ncbi:MAG: hypothetical protein KatS3mg060_1147 [Dehalococcoidia bacterium]|nr:MAG: hypothetical protein KatS3mg060_1147 [Dehalococcoidia bacterium]
MAPTISIRRSRNDQLDAVVALEYRHERERALIKQAGFRYNGESRTWWLTGTAHAIAPRLYRLLSAGMRVEARSVERDDVAAAFDDAAAAGVAGAAAVANALRHPADDARPTTADAAAREPAGPSRRVARYNGQCAVTGRSYGPGTSIVQTANGWAIDDAETARVQHLAQTAPIRFSIGEGYGGRLHRPGEVIRARWRAADGTEQSGIVVVLGAAAQYYRHDGMSFGVGDESGYVYTTYARPATDEEAAPLLQREARARARRDAVRRLEQLAIDALRHGDRPAAPATHPAGRELCHSEYAARLGNYWIIPADEPGVVYYVHHNGLDGDDWSVNNLPGAILVRVADPDGALRQELDRLEATLADAQLSPA